MSESSLIAGLGYVQEIIKRMAANSLFIKGWSMSLTGVMLAISKKDASNDYLTQLWLAILLFNFLFSILDAYYLKQERLFRNEYNRKVEGINDQSLKENLKIISTSKASDSIFSAYFSISVIPFYSFIIIFSCLIARGSLQ
ncbi:hypothetical protein [Klebsiella aerogenes]|uniref:hypothetical protein n=1 Tax=Klebsiella aerogenes TaxID=548 RepID=UPI002FFC9395